MNVSVVIPWREPRQRDRKEVAKWCFERYRFLWPEAEIIYADAGGQDFSRGKSINKGVKEASGNYIIIADSDYLIGTDMARSLINNHSWTIAVKSENYFYIQEAYTNYILENKPADVDINSLDFTKRIGTCPFPVYGGILAMPKENFMKVNFDPYFSNYGFEDNAFYYSMKAFFGEEYRTKNFMYHMFHKRNEESAYMLGSHGNKAYYDAVYKPILNNKAKIIELVNNYNRSGLI